MIRTMRSLEIQPGKDDEAFEFAQRVANYINEKSPGETMEVWCCLSGSLRQLHFVGSYDSLAVFDKIDVWMASDEGFRNFGEEIREKNLFVRATDQRQFFKVIA